MQSYGTCSFEKVSCGHETVVPTVNCSAVNEFASSLWCTQWADCRLKAPGMH